MASYNDYSDEQLSSMLEAGNKLAFTTIYNRYWHPLWVFAVKSLRTEEDAKDLVQDVFSTIWEKHTNIRIHTSLKAFLYKTMLHLLIKQVKKTKNAQRFYEQLQAHFDQYSDWQQSPTEQHLAETELIARFEEVVAGMPPKMKAAFMASRSEELNYQEIANQMGISRESVRTHIKHALKLLRKQLNSIVATFF